MIGKICFSKPDHVAQRREGGGQDDIIVAETEDTGVLVVDETTKTTVLEDVEELEAIKTVGKPSQDLPLTNSIADSETGGDFRIPADIGELVDIDEDDDSEENMADLAKHLAEENGELAKIKSFGLIH